MVTVTACLERQRKDGTSFALLEISGGVELVQSKETNKMYATLRRTAIPFTGTIDVARMLIGQKIEGEIVRVICEPYSWKNPRTGELLELRHSWAYQSKESNELIGHTKMNAFYLA